jgi:hypothetical protein
MATPSFETSETTYPATQRHIPEDWNSRLHHYVNLEITFK